MGFMTWLPFFIAIIGARESLEKNQRRFLGQHIAFWLTLAVIAFLMTTFSGRRDYGLLLSGISGALFGAVLGSLGGMLGGTAVQLAMIQMGNLPLVNDVHDLTKVASSVAPSVAPLVVAVGLAVGVAGVTPA